MGLQVTIQRVDGERNSHLWGREEHLAGLFRERVACIAKDTTLAGDHRPQIVFPKGDGFDCPTWQTRLISEGQDTEGPDAKHRQHSKKSLRQAPLVVKTCSGCREKHSSLSTLKQCKACKQVWYCGKACRKLGH